MPSITACTLVMTISSPMDFDEIVFCIASSNLTVTSHNAVEPPDIDAKL